MEGMGTGIRLLPFLPGMTPRVVLLDLDEELRRWDEKYRGPKSTPSGGNSNATPAAPAGPSLFDRLIGAADRLIARIIAGINSVFWSPPPQDIEDNPDMVGKGMVAGAAFGGFSKVMLSNSEVIARGGLIGDVDRLVKRYGGTRSGWVKKKGWDAAGKE
jgi:hypothetical protein